MNKKRNNKEFKICLDQKPNISFFVYRLQSKEKKITEKELLKEKKRV